MLGFSGVWIGNLTALEPFRPYFIAAAVVALWFAYRQIFRPAVACEPGEVCAIPQVRTTYKALFGAVVVLILIALSDPLLASLFCCSSTRKSSGGLPRYTCAMYCCKRDPVFRR